MLIYITGLRLFDLEETRTTGRIPLPNLIQGLIGSILVNFSAVMVNLLYFPRTCFNWIISGIMIIYAFYAGMYFLEAHYSEEMSLRTYLILLILPFTLAIVPLLVHTSENSLRTKEIELEKDLKLSQLLEVI